MDIVLNNSIFDTVSDMKSIILMSDGVIIYDELQKYSQKYILCFWNELKSMNITTDDDKTAIFFEFSK